MKRVLRAMWQGIVLLLCLCATGPAAAARHALLIGVSQYPSLAPELQLKAPANDVRLMRELLLQRGFDAAHMDVLADGVEGARMPTREAILTALQGLAERVRSGDTVHLHFSGHGSLQSVGTGAPAWQPVFLPRDVQRWNGKVGAPVPNAISDTLLRALVDRINDRGAFVFALFDACHSAKLVRGALPGTDAAQLRVRQVDPAALGLQGDAPPDVWPVWVSRPEAAAHSAGSAGEHGKAVYFYAAQSYELATAAPLAGGGEPAWHGLFSWHVAQGLALGQPMTYRQLGQHVLSRYDRLPASTATPLFSGDGLDEPVWGQRAPTHRQWPLAHAQGQWSIPSGALAGIAEGALLAVVTDPLARAGNGPTQPPQGTLGFVRVVEVEVTQSRVEPVAWQGWAALPPKGLSAGVWARLMLNPPSFTLRVAIDRVACADACLAGRALAQLQREGVPGVDVRWVSPNELPDLRLRAEPLGVRMLLPGAAEAGAEEWGFAAARGDEALKLESLLQQVGGGLHRVARTRNLLRLAARLALRPPTQELALAVMLRRQGAEIDVPVSPEAMPAFRPGDALLVNGRNAGGDPLDIAVFWLGADHSIAQVYPRDKRDSSRLDAGARLQRFALGVNPGSRGTERLLVLSVPMKALHETSDFRFLEQGPLTRLRSAADPALQALLDACFADYANRGNAAPALPADRLGVQVFTFEVKP